MGTPDFAVPSLRALIDNGYDVVGVFCQPDRPKGRGHKLAACPVKETAEAAGIPVFQPERIKRAEGVEALRGLAPDLCVTAAFGQLLSQEILDIPRLGTINVHASLLPRHRGSAPINWCVMMGETVTGITTMYTDIGMDTGDMLLKAETPIGETETAGELSDRLSELGAQLLVRTLRELEAGTLKRTQQNPQGDRPHGLDEDRARNRLSGARRDAVAGRIHDDGGRRNQNFQRETASHRPQRRARRDHRRRREEGVGCFLRG